MASEPTTHKFHFENYADFEQFRRDKLASKYPAGCLACTYVSLETNDLANAVDTDQMSEEDAKATASERALNVSATCLYGYSKEYGCSIGVLCRQDI